MDSKFPGGRGAEYIYVFSQCVFREHLLRAKGWDSSVNTDKGITFPRGSGQTKRKQVNTLCRTNTGS